MPWHLPAPVIKKVQEGPGHPLEAALIVVHALRAHLLTSSIWHKYLVLHCQPIMPVKWGLEHPDTPSINAEPFRECNLPKVIGKNLTIHLERGRAQALEENTAYRSAGLLTWCLHFVRRIEAQMQPLAQ